MTNLTMPSYFSISLANTRVKYTLFVLAYLIAAGLYWPSFSGLPVWDDMSYLFFDPVMTDKFPYSDIWKNFTWPLSVSLQKALISVAKNNFTVFHAINFLVHAFNSWLVYRLLRLLRMSQFFSYAGFLFFLIHPASVIAVAWMIQFKTLICFSFAMGSLILFIRARSKKDYVLSVILFLMSVLSKSSSLPLPLVLVFLSGRSWKSRKTLWIIPYLLVSIGGYYRLTNSQVAEEAIKHATEVTTQVAQAPETFRPVPDEPLVTPEKDFTPDKDPYEKAKKRESPVEPTLSNEDASKFLAQTRLVIKTMYYYFWQAFIPVENAPVKGLNPFPPSFQDYLHLIFLVLIVIITWKMGLFFAIVGAHIFLLPYLGIIPAPYMNVTWVSDQHLYLALPSFAILLFGLMEKVKKTWQIPVLSLMLIFFAWKTHEASKFYQNNFTFYEASIEANFNNIPLVYNLSMLYILNGREDEAARLMNSVIEAGQDEPYIRENRFYPFILDLRSRLRKK